MQRWWLAVWLLTAIGCDCVFALNRADATDIIDAPRTDLDGDGIFDDEDPCIAPTTDRDANEDGDALKNSDDPCPLDASAAGDTDNDMIPNACDPLPAMAGDRHRCLMAFTSTPFSAMLWQPRLGEGKWAPGPGTIVGNATSILTTIAAASTEGESVTSYDVKATFDTHGGAQGSLTLWLRASPDAKAATDIGCEYRIDAMGGALGVVEGAILRDRRAQGPGAGVTLLRLRGTIVTTGALGDPAVVTCSMSLGGLVRQVSTWSVPLASGRVGFSSDRFNAAIDAIHIFDHP